MQSATMKTVHKYERDLKRTIWSKMNLIFHAIEGGLEKIEISFSYEKIRNTRN